MEYEGTRVIKTRPSMHSTLMLKNGNFLKDVLTFLLKAYDSLPKELQKSSGLTRTMIRVIVRTRKFHVKFYQMEDSEIVYVTSHHSEDGINEEYR